MLVAACTNSRFWYCWNSLRHVCYHDRPCNKVITTCSRLVTTTGKRQCEHTLISAWQCIKFNILQNCGIVTIWICQWHGCRLICIETNFEIAGGILESVFPGRVPGGGKRIFNEIWNWNYISSYDVSIYF
jgi:hypothetical protein